MRTTLMRLIRAGEASPAVLDLQSRLERLGFEIDQSEKGRLFGASTEAAVRAFQQKRGLDVDGLVGDDTWRELVESSWSLGERTLFLRDPHLRGDDVRELQMRLNALGFSAGKHDGIFGPQTAAALKEFQRDLAITEDGIAGRETARALERLRLVTKPGLGPRIRERERRRGSPPGITGKRIAIDPGHGGDDGGHAVGNTSEAHLAFALAARLGQMLDAKGAVTVLTRGPHDSPREGERARIANEYGADLLVAVHFNAHPSPAAAGACTYYFEHDGVASEPGEHLAAEIQRALVEAGRIDCRSHGKAYSILRDTRMPAVVVEPCFLTNPEEAAFVGAPMGLDVLAGAIADGIAAYFEEDR